jgi:hypothetical protein
MNQDFILFLLTIFGLIIYLILSTQTEMFTKLPDFLRKNQVK